MSQSSSKIRVKIGDIEIDYEGESAFLDDGLPNLLEKAAELRSAVRGAGSGPAEALDDVSNNGRLAGDTTPNTNTTTMLSTSTIAQRIGSKTGSDLAMAAAVKLALVERQDKFTRQQLIAEMKGAPSFFQANMVGNLTKILRMLITNGRLNDVGGNSYALPAKERQAMEAKLAD